MKFSTAFKAADILLPTNCDMTKWSCVACDQYTSEPSYWERVDKFVADAPSTLRLTLPEIYLESDNVSERIKAINDNIERYLESGVFREHKNTMIYLERTQADSRIRRGLVGAIDLEEYDYHIGSSSAVRATEATVPERIPPRLKIRENALIELPHIMILIDDSDFTVIEPLERKSLEKVYDFDLMENGGHIKGYKLGEAEISTVDAALAKLSEKSELLFAMGDGNHSLATAKEHYEKLKREHPGEDFSNHPARYALCEIVNLHSDALEFEAIHRIITGVDISAMVSDMKMVLGLSYEPSEQGLWVHIAGSKKRMYIHNPTSKLTVGSLQNYLDKYIKAHSGKIDYIHGADVLHSLSCHDCTIGFELETMQKSELFGAVVADGALPRKTFSMGHAYDKRYYLEARIITK